MLLVSESGQLCILISIESKKSNQLRVIVARYVSMGKISRNGITSPIFIRF